MRQALERCNGPIRLKVKGHMNGDDVFYTLDGSTPTEKSVKYTGEFTVADINSFQIKAVCIVDGVRSEIVELNKSKSSVKIKFKPK